MKKEKIKKLGKYFGGIIAGGVLILAMTLLITVPISADDPNDATAQPPQGVEPEQPTYNEVKEVIHNPPVWRTYKDFNAWWGENRDHATLLTIGKVQGSDYFIHPMSALQTGIPSGTAVVLMTSNSYGWASTRNAQKDSTAQANLTSFLQGGGVVIVDMGDNDYYDGYLAPGAVGTPSYILETCQDATLDLAAVATNHPIIIGPDGIPGTADDLNNSNVDMAYSCYVAHGNLVDGITLPPDAKVIMTSTFGGVEKPILAEYCYQGGRVIVDTVTKEFVAHQPPGYGYTNVMKNLFSYALSPEAKCAPVNQPPTISNLGQFKSDGILPIDEISITTESTVVFKATLNDLENDKVKLQIELKEKDQPFNGQGLLESDFASSGNEVSIARYGLINDKYHWRARAVDEKRTASDWQEFGQIGNIDFEVKLVPLYTQVRSPYPSDNETKIWAVLPYAEGPAGNYDCGSTIAQCGCALTSGVMVLRYYDITTVNYEDVNPRTTNEWLKNNKGYFAGDVNWLKVAEYSDYRIKYDTAKSGNYVNNYTLLDKHLNKNQPVIAKEINPGHFIVIDNKLATTYGVKDPSWYNTKKLDEPTTDWASKIRDYNNNFYGLRLYYPGDGIAMKAISLSLASPAEILITDPLGRKLGKDPISDAEYNEIPDGSYFTENIDDPTGELPPSNEESKVIYIGNPIDGQYNIEIIGTGSGSYTLNLLFYDQNGQSKEIILEGNTETNNIQEFELDYSNQTVQQIEIYRIVDIDIKPGSDPNSINLKSKGVTPVAVLTDEFFDVKNVVIESILFTGTQPLRGNFEDVDNDGDLDLILHFNTQSLRLSPTNTEAVLTGQLNNGSLIKGIDSVRIVNK